MTRRDYNFFKYELDLIINSKEFNLNILGNNMERIFEKFCYHLKKLLLKYNLLNAENEIIVDLNCEKCIIDKSSNLINYRPFLISYIDYKPQDNICSGEYKNIDIDKIFSLIKEKFSLYSLEPLTYLNPFNYTKPLSPFYIGTGVRPALPKEDLEYSWKKSKKLLKCILLKTGEISLEKKLKK